MNPPLETATSARRRRFGLTAAALFAATLAAYLPALGAGFIWDDDAHVTRLDLRSLHGLWRIWFDLGATQQYYPVLHSAFWLEHHLWGGSALGYHLLNILLHATVAFLFVCVLRRFARAKRAFLDWPLLAGFLFALHPVCVESVAWISEQKNTLSAVFYLLAMLAYLKHYPEILQEDREENPDVLASSRSSRPSCKKWYFVSFLLFILALLSKSVTASLPGALLVILWWRRGRLSWKRDVVPLFPFFGAGLAAGLFTAWVEGRFIIGADAAAFDLTLVQRCLLAGRVAWFYFGKVAWPADLIFVYPRWRMGGTGPQAVFLLAALAVLAGLWLLRKRSRAPLAAALFFVGTLFPALGFFNVYPFVYSYVADHFQYLAMLGLMALAAGAWSHLAPNGSKGSLLVVCVLGILTWRQCRIYRNQETLYTRTIEANPAAWMAYNNLGNLEYRDGRMGVAIARYREALRLNPRLSEAENNLGLALVVTGHLPEALPHFRRAIEINPSYAEAYENLGVALNSSGRPTEALVDLEAALHLASSDDAVLRFNLGNAYAALGRYSEAIASYRKALELKPDYVTARCYLGEALAQTGDIGGAVAELRQAIADDPSYAPARHILSEIQGSSAPP